MAVFSPRFRMKEIARNTPPDLYRQRLHVNPLTGKLYVAEGTGVRPRKTFDNVLEIDPDSGRVRQVDLPFGAEDMAFDLNGAAYLRAYGSPTVRGRRRELSDCERETRLPRRGEGCAQGRE